MLVFFVYGRGATPEVGDPKFERKLATCVSTAYWGLPPGPSGPFETHEMTATVSKPEPIPHLPCEEYLEGKRAWINGLKIDEVDKRYPPAGMKGFNWKRNAWFAGWFDAKYEWRFGK